MSNRIEFTRSPFIKNALKSRYPQLAVFIVMLIGYIFAILAGLIGTPVGSRNFSIVFVWIAWWAILILVAVPFFGRGWCAVCPIPLPGEWLQRGAILRPERSGAKSKGRGLNLRWPKSLRNIWMQNISFLLLALFSSVLLTTPNITSIVLAAMLFAAIGLSMVFERRAFCRYLCPVGGFIGLYSQTAPIELRIKNKQVCVTCEGKPCYNGASTLGFPLRGLRDTPPFGKRGLLDSPLPRRTLGLRSANSGYGCPWDVFPGGLTKNTYCGLCMECIRTCPHDNIAINLRPFSADLAKPSTRIDEAFKAFIMLGSAMIYAGVLLGPWGALKDAAYNVGTSAWFTYAVVFLAIIFVILPGFFTLGILKTKSVLSLKQRFASLATALIPLGLMFWVAFSLSFVLTNATYIFASLSDPLGLGWNLFGTANAAWQPMLISVLAPAQTLALVGGLIWSARTAQKAASEIKTSSIPVIIFCFAATLVMLWLLL
ncbi:MAG: 4Fe-4S binding protein [Chloroflexi bacterium]|nr:4Fe-4S binding protein [Chloroflexota bacterium]